MLTRKSRRNILNFKAMPQTVLSQNSVKRSVHRAPRLGRAVQHCGCCPSRGATFWARAPTAHGLKAMSSICSTPGRGSRKIVAARRVVPSQFCLGRGSRAGTTSAARMRSGPEEAEPEPERGRRPDPTRTPVKSCRQGLHAAGLIFA